MEKTLIMLKPCTIQRELIGTIISRFEHKGLKLLGMKMMQLTDEILAEHYAHLEGRTFYRRLIDSMKVTPVIVCCFEAIDCVRVVREMTGATNGRNAQAGTIRGDFSISEQENIIHASDTVETAEIEIKRFFKPEEIFTYNKPNLYFYYATDEI